MLNFGQLWKNHPTINEDEVFPCRRPNGIPNFANQCAIRLGVALKRSGVLNGYDGVTCWYGHRGHGHTLRARELADYMKRKSQVFGDCEIRSNVDWTDYQGRHGLIFCENFWGENNTGDHIDLWDGTGQYMTASSNFYWEGPAMASGGLDYIERSQRVWFWQI
jgi:hypothetical protein